MRNNHRASRGGHRNTKYCFAVARREVPIEAGVAGSGRESDDISPRRVSFRAIGGTSVPYTAGKAFPLIHHLASVVTWAPRREGRPRSASCVVFPPLGKDEKTALSGAE